MSSEHKDFMEGLSETGEYSDEVIKTFTDALDKFKTSQPLMANTKEIRKQISSIYKYPENY